MDIDIQLAEVQDAPLIHELMICAFMEYKEKVPPSSALEETTQSIATKLEEGEQALICYIEDEPVGMIRFSFTEKGVYFHRLSVIPIKRGHGIAKRLVKELEEYALRNGRSIVYCKVRMNEPQNIQLYQSIGFTIYDEEIIEKPNGIHIKVGSMQKQIGVIDQN